MASYQQILLRRRASRLPVSPYRGRSSPLGISRPVPVALRQSSGTGPPQWVARNPARAFAMTFLDRCQGGDYTESQNRDGNLVGEGSGPSQPRVSGQARRSCLGSQPADAFSPWGVHRRHLMCGGRGCRRLHGRSPAGRIQGPDQGEGPTQGGLEDRGSSADLPVCVSKAGTRYGTARRGGRQVGRCFASMLPSWARWL
jgi:hypothetical protein